MSNREIDICICTFRRSHIIDTIQSVSKLKINSDWSLRVIVADNDKTPSSKEQVEKAAQDLPFPLIYIHAPARNISIARNACLDQSKAALIAFIDDDEIVDENWLAALLEKMDTTKADAVLGPVAVIYKDSCPQWVKDGNYHARAAVYVNGEIITGYTANVVFDKMSAPFKGLRFREELGRSGGEDSAFLKAAYRAGAKIEYAPDALVTEVIPDERTQFSWLFQRRYREGQTHGMMLSEGQSGGLMPKIKNILLAAIKSLFSFIVAPFLLPWKHRFYFWVFRGAMHAGVVSYLLGKPTLIQYGHEKEKCNVS